MTTPLDTLLAKLQRDWLGPKAPLTRRAYRCRCGQPLFFRNTQCVVCGAPLGYEPRLGVLQALDPGPEPDTVCLAGEGGLLPTGGLYRRCANHDTPCACNWLVPVSDAPQTFCVACRLNHTIPDLDMPGNAERWQRIETAKRRLVSSLVSLRLPIASRLGEDPAQGLAFDFVAEVPGGPPVLTGHLEGVITLNIAEADDAWRERTREAFGEPYRTLLGHFRHEVGHYYWDRLVRGSGWQEPFRIRFGDERTDYAAALQQHHQQGPPPDWPQRFVSAYASAHPWEDWAETWAHYLHMMDTLDTALSFGLDADDVAIDFTPFDREALDAPQDPSAPHFLEFVNAWTEISAVLNELSRSMGQPDVYPFVLSRPAVAKLHFVHRVVTAAAGA